MTDVVADAPETTEDMILTVTDAALEKVLEIATARTMRKARGFGS